MATLTKTVTLTSPAGGSTALLSDALSISMSKAVTVAGNTTLKKVDAIHTGEGTQIATAVGRSIMYIKNNSTTASNTVSIFSDSTGDTGADDDPDTVGADNEVETYELVMEIGIGEFALFPAALDFPLRAKATSASAELEVGIFTIA